MEGHTHGRNMRMVGDTYGGIYTHGGDMHIKKQPKKETYKWKQHTPRRDLHTEGHTHGGDIHGGDIHEWDIHGGDIHGGDIHGGDIHGGDMHTEGKST